MSRVADIIDLIQNANDFYLLNPARNIRSVYIQIDDICELAMKSWLQIQTVKRQNQFTADLIANGLITSNPHRTALRRFFNSEIDQATFEQAIGAANRPNHVIVQNALAANQDLQHWSASDVGALKTFYAVLQEIKELRPINGNEVIDSLHQVLDRFLSRRDNRNMFFHDHLRTGLNPSDRDCLEAFIDICWLCDFFFENEYRQLIDANEVVKAQIAIIKIRWLGIQKGVVIDIYNNVLRNRGTINLNFNSLGHEFCFLHDDALSFLGRIKKSLQDLINEKEREIQRINRLQKTNANHREQIDRFNENILLYKKVLKDCLGIVIENNE